MLHNDFRQMSMLLQNEHNVKRFLILAEGFWLFQMCYHFFNISLYTLTGSKKLSAMAFHKSCFWQSHEKFLPWDAEFMTDGNFWGANPVDWNLFTCFSWVHSPSHILYIAFLYVWQKMSLELYWLFHVKLKESY